MLHHESARCPPGASGGRLVGCRQAGAVITVVDPDAARAALVAGELSCPRPGCGGRLRVWSRAKPRGVRGLDGTVVTVTPDRGRCRVCRVSHILLPAVCLPRRGYDVEVVGAALLAAAEGAGYRRAAEQVDVPASTVRGWIKAVRDGAAGLTAAVIGVIEAAGARLHPTQAPPVWRGRALPEAVAALGVAARAFVLDLASPRPPGPGGRLTGINYLAILAERHRLHIHRQLRVIDPTGALAGLRGWPLINVLTRGRLLTTGPAG
jgi:hypothetical protein